MQYPRHAEALERRKSLLANRTKAELRFASHLKALGIRHQEQSVFHLDPYHYRIVDFYLLKPYRIVVELDGSVHDKPDVKSYDAWKDTKLETLHRKFRIIRFTNEEVFEPDFKSRLLSTIEKYEVTPNHYAYYKKPWKAKKLKRFNRKSISPAEKTHGRFLNLGQSVVQMSRRRDRQYGLNMATGFRLADLKQMGVL